MRTETQGARPKCRGKSIATACGAIAASLAFIGSANAESSSLPPQPVISVSASATSALPNDRMSAWLRAEVDNADPVAGANEINTRMGKALARAKAVRGVDASTTSYTSYQISERNQPTRWRISQTLQLESSDFAALAGLVSKIQSEDGLVLSGMNFSVSAAARRTAEDALTQQAIKSWQARAQAAAQGFGSSGWRPGHVAIQTGDFVRPQPMYRASAAQAAAGAPVATEGGTSDITVTVSGEAILEPSHSAR